MDNTTYRITIHGKFPQFAFWLAMPFYRSFGFAEQGNEFMDAGLPHIMMMMKLKV